MEERGQGREEYEEGTEGQQAVGLRKERELCRGELPGEEKEHREAYYPLTVTSSPERSSLGIFLCSSQGSSPRARWEIMSDLCSGGPALEGSGKRGKTPELMCYGSSLETSQENP